MIENADEWTLSRPGISESLAEEAGNAENVRDESGSMEEYGTDS